MRLQAEVPVIAVFIGTVLAAGSSDRSAVSSSHTENCPGQRFFGNGVHLLDDKATQRHILESDFLAVAGLHLNSMHGVIQQIAILCGSLQNGVAAAGDVLQTDDAVLIGGVSSCGILTAVAASNLELNAAQRLAGDTVNLGDQQAAVGDVVEGKGLGIIGIDNDGLAAGLGVDAIFHGNTSYYNKFTVKDTAASRVFFRIVAKAVRMRESWPDAVLQGP